MALELDGKVIETDANGYLANIQDWTKDVASVIAADEGIEMTDKHWEVIEYLREEFFDNNEHQPNNREIIKEMGKRWGQKLSNKDLFNLFPGNPSKQGGRIAGLPESRRKGGY